jgi:hydrogenase 3 maturation protease
MEKAQLRGMLSGRVVVACIGNRLRGDDGVGPFMAEIIKPSEMLRVVDCGETPENFLGVIVRMKPEKVVIVDAAHFGGEPGEVRVVKKSEIAGTGISTHDAILTLFANYIEAQTQAETFFLAIQPARSEVGEGLSSVVEGSAKALAVTINEIVAETPS